MNKIYSWAIQNAPKIDRDMLAHLANQMDENTAERFVSALLGIVDMGTIYAEIPGAAPDTNSYRNLRYQSYNYLQDEVTVSCESKYTRYFPTREEAEKWENDPEFVYAGNYEKTEKNPVAGVRWSKTTNHYPLERWIDMCNNK